MIDRHRRVSLAARAPRRAPALALLAGLALTAPTSASGGWPASVRVHQAVVPTAQLEPGMALPQLRVYDVHGRLAFEQKGYDAAGLGAALAPLLAGVPPAAPAHGADLATTLAGLQDAAGAAFAGVPGDRLTILQYGASWCLPCHALTGELRRLLAARPKALVDLVEIDADTTRASGQQHKDAAPEVVERLADPALTSDQRDELLFESLAASAKTKAASPPAAQPTPSQR